MELNNVESYMCLQSDIVPKVMMSVFFSHECLLNLRVKKKTRQAVDIYKKIK